MPNDYLVKKTFLSYTAVTMLATLAATVGLIVDSIIIGNILGEVAFAAAGIAAPVMICIVAAGSMLATGGITRFMQLIGEGKPDHANALFTKLILIAILCGIVLTGVFLIWGETIATLLGAKDATILLASEYIKGLGIGAIPALLFLMLSTYLRIDNALRLNFFCFAIMTCVNIVLDFVLTIQLHMGMFGMGLATSISLFVALCICLPHFFSNKCQLHLKKWADIKGKESSAAKAIVAGFPAATSRVCSTMRALVFNNLLAVGGIAALNVQTNAINISCFIMLGVAQTLSMQIGLFYGETDHVSMKYSLKYALKAGLVLSAITAVVLFLFAKPFVMLLGVNDAETIPNALSTVRWYALCMPFQMINTSFIYYYQSTEKPVLSNSLLLLAEMVFPIAFGLILYPFLGEQAIWPAFFAGHVLMTITLPLVIGICAKKRLRSTQDVLLLPERFYNRTLLSLSYKNDVTELVPISQNILAFCKENEIDQRRSFFAALCMEEIFVNIVKHGFHDTKKHFIDIRVIACDNQLIIRVIDDGKAFNPMNYTSAQDDNISGIGIKLLRGIAKKVTYQNTLGLNNLLVCID